MNLQVLKADNKSEANGLAIAYDEQKVADKIAALPFTLTGGQRRSLDDILADIAFWWSYESSLARGRWFW